MATVNLGRIKPVFRGAYAGGTAYVVDDIVTSGDETFICIQASTGNATSNASYWTKLAAKGTDGTDGTDVGTTLTTQGDILYRDGSGLARLGYGTSGKVLTTKGSGQNPTWETAVGGKVGQITSFTQRAVQSATSYAAFTNAIPNFAHSITPSATSSKILVEMDFVWGDSDWVQFALYSKVTAGGTYAVVTNAVASATGGGNRLAGTTANGYARGHNNSAQQLSLSYLDTPNTTSEMFYTLYFASHGNHAQYLNRSYQDDNYATIGRQVSTITLTEVLA